MTEHKVNCPFDKKCEYGGYSSICKDCKRNGAANIKNKKYDLFNIKSK